MSFSSPVLPLYVSLSDILTPSDVRPRQIASGHAVYEAACTLVTFLQELQPFPLITSFTMFSRTLSVFSVILAAVSIVNAVQCTCPPINGFELGSFELSGPPAIQCAFPNGSCVWDEVGPRPVILLALFANKYLILDRNPPQHGSRQLSAQH